MAVGVLPEPGSHFGPCAPVTGKNGVVLNCGHRDCEQTRTIAASVCLICGAAIGYDTAFFRDDEAEGKRWVHAVCAEDKAEKERRAQQLSAQNDRIERLQEP